MKLFKNGARLIKNESFGLNHEYNALMGSLQVAVSKHLLDEHFTVIWANAFYFKKTGYTQQEYENLYHNHVSEYFKDDPKTYAILCDVVRDAFMRGDTSYEHVCPMRVKGGGSMWIRVVGTFTNELINNVPVVYSVFTDVTDIIKMRAEQTVTYNNLPGFVAKFRVREGDEHFYFLNANKKFIDFFGDWLSAGKPYSLTNMDTETNRLTLEENFPAMRAGKPVSFVLQAKCVDGKISWFQLNAACVDHVHSDPVYLVLYIDITDITEQRALRKKLEMRSEQLHDALIMAKRANQAKSDFLSRMSHDIRTPMNAIIGMLHLISQSWDSPSRIRDYLKTVESSARFLLSLINDILDVSKIESGKMTLKKAHFDFAAFLREITTMFFISTANKELHFDVSICRDLAEAYIGDKLKLNRIIMNLLGNSVKFTESGGTVSFYVAMGERRESATEIIFTVKDTGMGMDKEFMKKLFQPFEQDASQSKNSGGTGLGLAIADHYAKLMGGDIQVKSEPGKGSQFITRVWLEDSEPIAPKKPYQRFDRTRCLVIHPNPDDCRHVGALLENFGVRTKQAASADAALELLDEAEKGGEPFGVLTMDWDESQAAVSALLRSMRERFGSIKPTIGIIAYDTSKIDLKREEEEGARVTCLQKPLSSSILHEFLCSNVEAANPSAAESRRMEALFNGECVLLVEDNAINLQIATTLLKMRNICVECAHDGLEAVNMFNASVPGHYCTILMDIQMPVLNGLDAARRIRALPRKDAATIPIIALSANAFEEDVEASLNAGMNYHLSKPIDFSSLFALLGDICKS